VLASAGAVRASLEPGAPTLRSLHRLFAASLLAVAFSTAIARAEEREVSGTIEADPLRIKAFLKTYIITGQDPLAQSLDAVAGMGRRVTARLDVGVGSGFIEKKYLARVLSVSGHATAPSPLLSAPRSDATRLETVGAQTDYTITGVDAGFMRVELPGGQTGYVPASFVSVGADHWIARKIGRDILGPIFGRTSAKKEARTFHPDGFYFEGAVTSLDPPAPYAALANRLVGSAVVRPSLGAHEAGSPDGKFDVAGFTIRLTTTGAPIGPDPSPGDQNFTFLAGLKSLAHIVISPFTQNQFDYLDPTNVYYPAISYRVAGEAREISLRVVAEPYTPSDPALVTPRNGAQRDAKLKLAVQERKAALRIEGKIEGGAWTPLVRIAMERPLSMDNEAFRYHPDLAGRGLIPQGAVNALRATVYPASQAARPRTAAERAAGDSGTASPSAPTPTKGFADRLTRIGD
jgi:hypothetical protein